MTKYREILRLLTLRLSQRDISFSLKVSRNTIAKVHDRAKELSLSWPLDESLTDVECDELQPVRFLIFADKSIAAPFSIVSISKIEASPPMVLLRLVLQAVHHPHHQS